MLLQSRAAFLEGLLAAGPAMVNALPPPACNPADPFEYSRLRFFDTCAKANTHARVRSLGGISCVCVFVCACVRVLSRKYARCGLHAGTSRGISRHAPAAARILRHWEWAHPCPIRGATEHRCSAYLRFTDDAPLGGALANATAAYLPTVVSAVHSR